MAKRRSCLAISSELSAGAGCATAKTAQSTSGQQTRGRRTVTNSSYNRSVSQNPVEIAFEILAFLFALSVHEASHAFAADKLGDDTARRLGRVTLNPLPHIDLVGTILLPAFGLLSGLPVLGWAKPTPVNPSKLRHPRRDDILVPAAGPASNLVVAIVSVLLLLGIRVASPEGAVVIEQVVGGYANLVDGQSASVITPIALLL